MVTIKKLTIINKLNYEIDTDLYNMGSSSHDHPLIVFAHGFKGFKDWGGFPFMMNKFAEAGYAAVSFNFTFNGVAKNNPMDFTRLDLFAKNTYSQELDDMKCVIDYFYNNAEQYTFDKDKIALIGHSRGGGIAIITASEDKRIKTLITLSSVSDFDRYSIEHKMKWREKGFFEVLNTRTNQLMRINATLLEDIEKNKDRLNIQNAVSKINIPFLIIHGKEDQSVKFSEAEILYEKSNKMLTEFYPVEKTGHTFGVVHPFQGSTFAFDLVIDKILSFLNYSFQN